MRKRAVAASILASMGIITVGWQIGAATATPSVSTSAGAAPGATSGTVSSGASSAPAATTTAPTATTPTTAGTGLKNGTYTGASEQTVFGNVQVQVTISGGKITEVKAVRLTDHGQRSVQISNYAAPILRQEVIASQSTKVSNVNGATYTTDGYLSSMQSALDQAAA